MKEIFKNKKGITLIALIITIIVLLILAGVTISTLTGENGILTQAGNAKEQTEIANEKEIIQLAAIQAMEKNNYGDLTKSGLKEELNDYIEEDSVNVYDNVDTFVTKFIVKFENSNRYYEVDSNGNTNQIYVVIDSNPGNMKLGINGETLTGENEDTAYEIWCIEDLIEWSKNYSQYANSYIKLCKNLNFKSELSYYNAQSTEYGDINDDGKIESLIEEMQKGIGFVPIYNFSGYFNGENNTIYNIYISSSKSAGLIDKIDSATIIGIKIYGNITSTNGSAGGIIANACGNCILKNLLNGCNVSTTNGHAGGVLACFLGNYGVLNELYIYNCVNLRRNKFI